MLKINQKRNIQWPLDRNEVFILGAIFTVIGLGCFWLIHMAAVMLPEKPPSSIIWTVIIASWLAIYALILILIGANMFNKVNTPCLTHAHETLTHPDARKVLSLAAKNGIVREWQPFCSCQLRLTSNKGQ